MLCHKCKKEITSTNYIVIEGKSFHKDCYIFYSSELLRCVKEYIPEIIDSTKNNMKANSIARKILRKFDEDNTD